MDVQDLDHLGIIAGVIDQMGLEARVNECLGTHPQQKVSPGQGLKAMILNALGFVSAPLYLYEGFFKGKATEHLLGEGVTAFAQQWNLDGILVADSALYSAANLAQMGDLRWITRFNP